MRRIGLEVHRSIGIWVLECDFPGVERYRIGFTGFAAIQDIAQNGAADSSELCPYLMEPPGSGMNLPQAAVGLVLEHAVRQDRFLGGWGRVWMGDGLFFQKIFFQPMMQYALWRCRGMPGECQVGFLYTSLTELGVQAGEAALLFGDQHDAAGRPVQSVYDTDERAVRCPTEVLKSLVFERIHGSGLAFHADAGWFEQGQPGFCFGEDDGQF